MNRIEKTLEEKVYDYRDATDWTQQLDHSC